MQNGAGTAKTVILITLFIREMNLHQNSLFDHSHYPNIQVKANNVIIELPASNNN
jgi:hypothetical protein